MSERVQRELGKCIRAARVEAGLSQEEAATLAGIDYKRWQRLEQGTVNATVRTLTRVAEALSSDFWKLMQSGPKK